MSSMDIYKDFDFQENIDYIRICDLLAGEIIHKGAKIIS